MVKRSTNWYAYKDSFLDEEQFASLEEQWIEIGC